MSRATARGSVAGTYRRIPRAGISFGSTSLFRNSTDRNFELDQVQALGAKVVRFDCKDTWYTQVDTMVAAVQSRSMEPLLIMGGQLTTPLTDSAWTTLVTGIRDRYTPMGVRLFETPNEPNAFAPAWTAAILAAQTKIAYPIIKAVPGTFLAAGAFGIFTDPVTDLLNWVTNLYATGNWAGYFDALSIHIYNDSGLTRTGEHGSWSSWDATFGHATYYPNPNNVVSKMAANGDGGKPIWCTECGDTIATGGTSYQADAVKDAIADTRPKLSTVYTMLDDDFAGFGLLDGSNVARPAVAAYKSVTGAP